MFKRLSILICSITGRENSLHKLLSILKKQENNQVEILIEIDNKEITTGEKRNNLLEKAKGDYIVFIDDDDEVSDDYIEKILKALESNPDSCGIEGEIRRKEEKNRFISAIEFNCWHYIGKTLCRSTNHLNPVKRELALKVKFPLNTHGEDEYYAMRLRSLINTEVKIEGPIYYYNRNYWWGDKKYHNCKLKWGYERPVVEKKE